MEFKDNRSKRVVFLGNCIINQNARFPGIAVKEGPFVEFAEILMKNGIGIEQMPCLECLGWGGVSRKTYYQFQPMILRFIDTKIFPFLKVFYHIWLLSFSWLCHREAVRVAQRIEDYTNSGYQVLGIVASNDSPTCGISRTMGMIDAFKKFKILVFSIEDLENPNFNQMQHIIPALCTDGTGLFMKPLKSQLQKRDLKIKMIGFEPWAESIRDEAHRVSKLLDI